ncbi:AI-2E family transporter [Vagococcus entomophilus]|uniref:AI-2E family transporter n=1 Tax=Vagococcus entomophilus TaxID=1160095 RepID=UPI001475363D|nr:AI-2E family transporter [Vagococcus entomophilus]
MDNALKKINVRRFIVFGCILLFLFCFKEYLSLFLLTSIFSYLAITLGSWVHQKTHLPEKLITFFLYVIALFLLYLVGSNFLPLFFDQVKELANYLYKTVPNLKFSPDINRYLDEFIRTSDFTTHIQKGISLSLNYLTNIGSSIMTGGLAIFLSFIYSFTRNETKKFGDEIVASRYGVIFSDIHFFFKKFVLILGRVMETQLIICTINTFLMTIVLSILGFPNLIVLTSIIFILGLIPVAGVLVSLVPISLIGFSIGGIKMVVAVLILIACIHFFESYILQPKLMSKRANLPVFYTFVTLIVSEQLLGAWGLIVGIPIVLFILNILGAHVDPTENKEILDPTIKEEQE